MIYTIGHRRNYLSAIATNGTIQKVGKREKSAEYPDGYEGGYAFKTYNDAQRRINEQYINNDFGIFGLDADWETDTMPSKNGWWHNLLKDADIIILDNQ